MGDITKTEPAAAAPAMRTRPWTPFIRGVQAVALSAGVVFAVACSGAEPSTATATAPLPATRLTEAVPAPGRGQSGIGGGRKLSDGGNARGTPNRSNLVTGGSRKRSFGVIARDKANRSNPSIDGGRKLSDGGNAPVRLTEATSSLTAAENAPLRLSPATVPATGVTLSANDASISELAASFESAGISNAQRWAREADEYRPYSVDDTGYTKLRGELAKYNPASGVVDTIVARLHLP